MPVWLGIALITVAFAIALPRLRPNPDPYQLMNSFGDYKHQFAQLNQRFGLSNDAILVLVEAPTLLDAKALGYLHRLASQLTQEPWAQQVVSLTNTPWPLPSSADGAVAGQDEELDLDALEAEEDSQVSAQQQMEQQALGALRRLARAVPDAFPEGEQAFIETLGRHPLLPQTLFESTSSPEEAVTRLRTLLKSTPSLEKRLISEDHTLTLIAVGLSVQDRESFERMQQRVGRVQEIVDKTPKPKSLTPYLAGVPFLSTQLVASMQRDQMILFPMTLLICMGLLWLSFRWLAGVLLPLVAVLIANIWLVGTIAWCDEPLMVLSNIIPCLLMIIGISDAIHLINRYREEVAAGKGRWDAAVCTVRAMASACLWTSVTTAVGLASLAISPTRMLQHFGGFAAWGVMIAYVITMLVLPGALLLFRLPKQGTSERTPRRTRGEKALVMLTRFTIRRRRMVLVASLLVFALCALLAMRLKVDSTLLDQFDANDPGAISTRLIERKLDGFQPLELHWRRAKGDLRFDSIEALRQFDSIQTWAGQQPEVLSTTSVVDVLAGTWRLLRPESPSQGPLHSSEQAQALMTLARLPAQQQGAEDPLRAWISNDAQDARLQIKLRDEGSQAAIRFVERLRVQVKRATANLGGKAEVTFTGPAYASSVGLDSVVRDLLYSLFLAVGIIVLLLALVLRSVRYALVSVPINILPLCLTLACMAMGGMLLNTGTVIIFPISLGLAVDGTIHVLQRFREERASGLLVSVALLRAARGTGHAIIVSCVALMLGFSVFAASGFLPVRQFGVLVTLTIAGCLIATLVVQPALLRAVTKKRA